MKRIIALLLSVVLVISCGMIGVSAQTKEYTGESEELYRERFIEEYIHYSWQNLSYRELYHHFDESGSIDWVLVNASYGLNTDNGDQILVRGHRVILICPWESGAEMLPFVIGYGIYDVKQDQFFDITTADVSRYDDFDDVYDQYGYGRFIGDVDRDYEISMIDVTIIQRCVAGMRDFPEDDKIELHDPRIVEQEYYSDFNRDGERDLLDATCIQRYLAGLPYPIG